MILEVDGDDEQLADKNLEPMGKEATTTPSKKRSRARRVHFDTIRRRSDYRGKLSHGSCGEFKKSFSR